MQKLMRIDEVARRTGYTLATCYEYHRQGILPPPRIRVGYVMLFAPADIREFMKGRKTRRKRRH